MIRLSHSVPPSLSRCGPAFDPPKPKVRPARHGPFGLAQVRTRAETSQSQNQTRTESTQSPPDGCARSRSGAPRTPRKMLDEMPRRRRRHFVVLPPPRRTLARCLHFILQDPLPRVARCVRTRGADALPDEQSAGRRRPW